MGKVYRAGRLGEEIRKILSEMIISEIKDPRVREAMVSVSSVDVTRDGSYATCYITVLTENGAAEEELTEEDLQVREEVLEGLRSAKGLIKKEIGKKIKVRHVPELIFKIDTSMDYGRHIDKVLRELDIKDEDVEDEE